MAKALYFQANDGTNGFELWRVNTNGIAENLPEINGTGSSAPTGFTNFNGELYFSATNGTSGVELYKVTAAGVVQTLPEINGTGGSFPAGFTVFNNELYFQATDGVQGTELWKVNTSGAYTQFPPINPGGFSSNPTGLTVFNNELYFAATDSAAVTPIGNELWKVTLIAGVPTVQPVLNINPTAASSNPSGFTVFNTTLGPALYFSATTVLNGNELYQLKPDGSLTLISINLGGPSSSPNGFTVFNNELYFQATNGLNGTELWKVKADGTSAVQVGEINPAGASSTPTELTVFNNDNGSELFFAANDSAAGTPHGTELWKVPAAGGNPVLVADINSLAPNGSPFGFTVFNNVNGPELFFAANDGATGFELWKVKRDGVTAVRVKDINTTAAFVGSSPFEFTVFNNELYFSANNGPNGNEVWRVKADGTTVELVKDINPLGPSSFPSGFTVFNSAPVAVNDTVFAPRLVSLGNATGNVLTNDTDADDADASLAVSAFRTGAVEGYGTSVALGAALTGAHGSLTLNANGSYSYAVNASDPAVIALSFGTTLTDSFNYTVRDSSNFTDTAVLTVSVGVAAVQIDNTTTNLRTFGGIPYSGPVAGLQYQYIDLNPNNLNLTGLIPNGFIHSGPGFDAIDVSNVGGTNVLDGGTNSNFLVGGTAAGSFDTFFVDNRNPPGDIWSTVVNFHKGDDATVWGVTQAGFNIAFAPLPEGATGYTGLTLHVTKPGVPNASLTLAGYSTADLTNGKLSTSFGTVGGSDYFFVHGN